MITATSLKHPRVKFQLEHAMRKAIRYPGCGITVYNKRERPWVGVVYLRGELAWKALGRFSGFFWYSERDASDMTDMVAKALRGY